MHVSISNVIKALYAHNVQHTVSPFSMDYACSSLQMHVYQHYMNVEYQCYYYVILESFSSIYVQ